MADILTDALAWPLLEKMLLVRRFEEAVVPLSTAGHFRGHYHLYIGQEATGVPAIAALGPADHIATTHRNHGHMLARGADPGAALAEILGRATGLNRGRGGTIHLCEPSLGFLSTSGIVGGCISLAVGGGYACRQRRDGSERPGRVPPDMACGPCMAELQAGTVSSDRSRLRRLPGFACGP